MRADRAGAGRWWTLGGFCLVLYVSVSFKSMVGIAIPELQEDLEASLGQIQWVLNAYTLMLAALLLTGGALADRYGRRRLYVIGLVVFPAGAVACLLSPSATMLDLSSGLMGIGGALFFAAGVALLSQRFTGRDRAAAFGVFGMTVAAGAASGPLVGGVLIDAFGWRGVFGFLALLAAAGLVVELARGSRVEDPVGVQKGIDWIGPVTFSGAIFLLNFALIRGNDLGFGSATIVGSVLSGLTLLGLFAASQVVQRRERSRREPMLDLGMLRRPSVAGAAVASFALGFVAFGLTFYAAIYIGRVLQNTPTETGLKLLPLTAVAFAVAPIGGWLMRRRSPRALLPACLLLMAGGSLLLRGLDQGSDWTALAAGFVVIGLGAGAIVPPLISTAVSVVPPARAGVAAAINNTARQLGIAFGVAGLGSYFQARAADRLESIPGVDAGAVAEVIVGGQLGAAAQGVPASAREQVAAIAPDVFFGGLNDLFLMLAGVAVLGAVIAMALIRERDFVIPAGGRVAARAPTEELAAAP